MTIKIEAALRLKATQITAAGLTKDDIPTAVRWIETIGIKVDPTTKPQWVPYGDHGYIVVFLRTSAKASFALLSANSAIHLKSSWKNSGHWKTCVFVTEDEASGLVELSVDTSDSKSVSMKIFNHVPNL